MNKSDGEGVRAVVMLVESKLEMDNRWKSNQACQDTGANLFWEPAGAT
jgi:hypothetical protein